MTLAEEAILQIREHLAEAKEQLDNPTEPLTIEGLIDLIESTIDYFAEDTDEHRQR